MRKSLFILCVLLVIGGCQKYLPQETLDERRVSFIAVGDNLMHQKLLDEAKTAEGYDFMKYYVNVQDDIQKADLAFVNQETILGGEQFGVQGYPRFNTPDIMAQNLHDVGFNIVNGATNHALDQGEVALLHSLSVFQQYDDMVYLGLYDSQKKRDEIEVIEKNGMKIAFLSYNQLTNGHSLPHTYNMNLFDRELIQRDVENAKEISDFIVVSCHWGNEYDLSPNNFQREYALFMADLGVDVIIGTHPHTLQPIEYIEGHDGHRTLVAYSLGNFVSGMMEEDTQLEGMLSFDFVERENMYSIENVTLTPLVNHYEIDDLTQAYETRHGFTVYRLKDYSEALSQKHGLNGYLDIEISIHKMKDRVRETITSGINVEM